jgi:hypothetical protein
MSDFTHKHVTNERSSAAHMGLLDFMLQLVLLIE